MGGTRKSSKRKSSKTSSEARRKKRSRKTKSRKIRRRNDSSSNSRSAVSISSSSSEDEYSRARSRTRGEVKGGGRKKTRRSSSSCGGSSEDSRYVKKRKGSKRSSNSYVRKKSQKKKRRREPSVSSISRDSRSCSTCRGGSSSGGDSEVERPRGRSRDKKNDKRDSGKAKSGTKRNKNRSRSQSSYSRYSDNSGYSGKEVLPVENSVRRLRSVITVAKPPEGEEKEWDKDGHKEEIVYEHDDYPSCRSNDSNDGASKRELTHHSRVDPERRVDDVMGEEGLVSDHGVTKLPKSVEEGGVLECQDNSYPDGAGANNSSEENKTGVLPKLSSSNIDDLESILRLKALENLRKYRGGFPKNTKPPAVEKNMSDGDLKQLSTAKTDFVENTLPKEDASSAVGTTRVLDQKPRPTKATMGRDSSRPATSYGKVQEFKGSVTESRSATRNVICPPNQVAVSGNSKAQDPSPAGAVTRKSELGKSAPKQESSGTIERDVNKFSSEANNNNNGVEVNNVHVHGSSISEPPSSVRPTLEEHNSKEQQCEHKEGSQFEEKTMSVMRGGEMVQVSYKVYIPKKAPALARRHLRR